MLALVLVGIAGAEDCPEQSLQVVGSLPANHATGVPVDARVIGILGDGQTSQEEWTLTLDWDQGAYPGSVESWCHPDGGPDRSRCFLAFTPEDQFPPNRDFNVILQATDDWDGEGSGREVLFITTGSTDAIAVEGQPTVKVIAARDQATECGWDGARVWDLTLTPASTDFYGLSLLHVYSVDTDDGTSHVATRAVPAAGGLVSVTVARDAADPWTDCFVAIQEDARGDRSPASEIACYTPDPDTGEPQGDGGLDAGGCGCAAPGSALGGAWWLPLMAWGRRRRSILPS